MNCVLRCGMKWGTDLYHKRRATLNQEWFIPEKNNPQIAAKKDSKYLGVRLNTEKRSDFY